MDATSGPVPRRQQRPASRGRNCSAIWEAARVLDLVDTYQLQHPDIAADSVLVQHPSQTSLVKDLQGVRDDHQAASRRCTPHQRRLAASSPGLRPAVSPLSTRGFTGIRPSAGERPTASDPAPPGRVRFAADRPVVAQAWRRSRRTSSRLACNSFATQRCADARRTTRPPLSPSRRRRSEQVRSSHRCRR